ncbi:MAG TPA: amylo-alpha-1,6-glucosidase [Methylomirabilota bacterium]|nr:amylo-alpha-1,6-glucosidase [Methylomirabilota bacterium]
MKGKASEKVKKSDFLWRIGFETIQELEQEQGILASGKEEIYGCIFGRDSLISALKLLRTYSKTKNPYFLSLVKKILLNLATLQGTSVNIESGEEPGKMIHEYRPTNHEHLTQKETGPWYLYQDKIMRNYDSVDSTPLFLITSYRYIQASGDTETAAKLLPNVEKGLEWMRTFADINQDGFIDYHFHPNRQFGGLKTQSWMDSHESLFHDDDQPTPYPIAPVEVQAYVYLAYKLWANYFTFSNGQKSLELEKLAQQLKARFNKSFLLSSDKLEIAAALDGNGKPLRAARSSMGHILWASVTQELDGYSDSILDYHLIPALVDRLLAPDLFEPEAGIRTLSSLSHKYDPNSYHNGSIWPHDTAIIAEGMENFRYLKEAKLVRASLRKSWQHFGTAIELFVYSGGQHREYLTSSGRGACKKQAWSAASILAEA